MHEVKRDTVRDVMWIDGQKEARLLLGSRYKLYSPNSHVIRKEHKSSGEAI